MKEHTILAGPFGSGKTTVAKELERRFPEFHHVKDQARVWLEQKHRNVTTLNRREKRAMEAFAIEGYVTQEELAEKANKRVVFDSSLVEVLVYSKEILTPREVHMMHTLLHLYKHNYHALVFPPTIPLVNDNLRHTNQEYRIQVYTDIVQTLKQFSIPFSYITEQTIRGRVEEVIAHITQESGTKKTHI